MHGMKRIILVLASSFGLAVSAAAETADAPDLHVGDRWSWQHSNLMSMERDFTKIEDVVEIGDKEFRTRIRVKGTAGNAYLTYASGWVLLDTGSERYQPGVVRYAFPLSVGKKWNDTFDRSLLNSGRHGKFEYSAEVVAMEKVTVPAGTFDAYKIIFQFFAVGTDADANVATTKEVHWYAPVIKNDIKSESTLIKDGMIRSKDGFELLDNFIH